MIFQRRRSIDPSVYLVADHLDSALAAAEDLLALAHTLAPPKPGASAEEHLARSAGLRDFVEQARRLEMVLAARALQARRRADELRRADARFKPLVALFVAGTAALADAVDDLADSTRADFQSGEQPLAYLRSRAIVPADSASLEHRPALAVGEGFRVAQRIRLGELMDLAATFLDALDLHYDLYGDDEIAEEEAA
jgi:hypothetical protein